MKHKMKIEHRYLVFPIDESKNCVSISVIIGDRIVEQVFCNLHPDCGSGYKTMVDMSEFIGKEVLIMPENCKSEWAKNPVNHEYTEDELDALVACIENSDDYTDKPHYTEKYRPKFHYTTQRGWMNDPNGCIYYDGLYHLYYQHCPGATYAMWDNNHWGHAVSRDLISWEEYEPVMRFPHEASGTGFIDRRDGLPCVTTGNKIFKSHDSCFHFEFMSFNTDGSSYPGDPKILYHEESGKYIAVTLKDLTTYSFASSPDLETWQYESEITNFRECPDMVRYRIEGTDTYKWILNGGDGAYMIGEFDGHEFKPDPIPEDRVDQYLATFKACSGFTNKYNGAYVDQNEPDDWERFTVYAFQNFDNAPNGRKVRIAWYTVNYSWYGEGFNQAMTIPQELTLAKTGFGVRLCAQPVRELEAYRGGSVSGEGKDISLSLEGGQAFDVTASIAQDAKISLHGFDIRYSAAEKRLYIAPPGKKEFYAPFVPMGDTVDFRAVFDTMTAEFYFGKGEVYVPVKPENRDLTGIELSISGKGKAVIFKLEK